MKTTLALLLAATSLLAVDTKYWQENEQSDFEKGTLKNVSLRSDGRLSVAPEVTEIYDTSVPYLWAIARDSKGNLYTGGGSSGGDNTKVFVTEPSGKSRVLAAVPGLEIHAIALDQRDQLFVATNPDGKVFRIGHDAKPVEFFNPKTRYIWALAFDSHNNLYVATGDDGQVFRVTPDGKSTMFFDTQDTHARSLAVDRDDNLLVGTDPSGLVIRVSPAGTGFVLYQAARKEITAIAVAASGAIWAAGNGAKTPALPVVPAPAVPNPAQQQAIAAAQAQMKAATPVAPHLPLGPPTLAGGSEVYRIEPDGTPRRVWSDQQVLVYAIAFDSNGLPLIGTGNSGRVYRLDSDVLSTVLLDVPPTQITAFTTGAGGVSYAVTGNIGKVYRIGPGLSKSGTYESDIFDAGQFSRWGRVTIEGATPGVAVSTRSGNVSRTQNNWSPWAPVTTVQDPGCASCRDGKVTSPAARFAQYRLEFTGSGSLTEVDLAYLPRNVAPVLEQIEVAPANYRFPMASVQAAPPLSPLTITLPALGARHASSSGLTIEPASVGQALTYSKGTIGARWAATDENGDSLEYRVEIRGVGQPNWLLLKDKVREKYINIDSSAFPDGEYELRVTASDSPSNPEGEALTVMLTSDPFLIDNTPPPIFRLSAEMSAGGTHVKWAAKDTQTNIARAEYSVDGGEWKLAGPVGGLSDWVEEEYEVAIPGKCGVVAVRVTDDFDNSTVRSAVCH